MTPLPHPPSFRAGFTLIEVMVALVIFSMISVGTFGVLSNLLRAHTALEEHGEQLATLQRLTLAMHHDISQIAPRAPDMQNTMTPVVQAPAASTLAFPRAGWHNPLDDERSTLAYVRYDLVEGTCLRKLWPLAQAARANPVRTERLAEGVTSLSFRRIEPPVTPLSTHDTKRTPRGQVLPLAIEVMLALPGYEGITQLIAVAQTP